MCATCHRKWAFQRKVKVLDAERRARVGWGTRHFDILLRDRCWMLALYSASVCVSCVVHRTYRLYISSITSMTRLAPTCKRSVGAVTGVRQRHAGLARGLGRIVNVKAPSWHHGQECQDSRTPRLGRVRRLETPRNISLNTLSRRPSPPSSSHERVQCVVPGYMRTDLRAQPTAETPSAGACGCIQLT